MGILTDQAIRLLKTRWRDPNQLAEELYAILTSDAPVNISGPVTITNSSGEPDLTIDHQGAGDYSVVIRKATRPDINFPDLPFLPIDPGDTNWSGWPVDDPTNPVEDPDWAPDAPPAPQPRQQGGGGGFPCRVVSGSGNTYSCAVYEDGLAAAPSTRSVRQLQISAAATIPAGTWAVAGKAGGAYFMQVPVWLEDLPP